MASKPGDPPPPQRQLNLMIRCPPAPPPLPPTRGSAWKCADWMLEGIKECELKPNGISLSASLNACEKGGV